VLGGVFVCRDLCNGVCDGFGGWLIEEGAGALIDDGVECAPGVSCDDRAPGGLGFDGGDAEVFDLWEEEEREVGAVLREVGWIP